MGLTSLRFVSCSLENECLGALLHTWPCRCWLVLKRCTKLAGYTAYVKIALAWSSATAWARLCTHTHARAAASQDIKPSNFCTGWATYIGIDPRCVWLATEAKKFHTDTSNNKVRGCGEAAWQVRPRLRCTGRPADRPLHWLARPSTAQPLVDSEAPFFTGRAVQVLDFGLAKRWRDESGEPVAPQPDPPFRGTSLYASLHVHAKFDYGRRDDMFSLYFALADMLLGGVPWRAHTGNRERILASKKALHRPARLFEKLPRVFMLPLQAMFDSITALGFTSEPDYSAIAQSLSQLADAAAALEMRHSLQVRAPGLDEDLLAGTLSSSDEDDMDTASISRAKSAKPSPPAASPASTPGKDKSPSPRSPAPKPHASPAAAPQELAVPFRSSPGEQYSPGIGCLPPGYFDLRSLHMPGALGMRSVTAALRPSATQHMLRASSLTLPGGVLPSDATWVASQMQAAAQHWPAGLHVQLCSGATAAPVNVALQDLPPSELAKLLACPRSSVERSLESAHAAEAMRIVPAPQDRSPGSIPAVPWPDLPPVYDVTVHSQGMPTSKACLSEFELEILDVMGLLHVLLEQHQGDLSLDTTTHWPQAASAWLKFAVALTSWLASPLALHGYLKRDQRILEHGLACTALEQFVGHGVVRCLLDMDLGSSADPLVWAVHDALVNLLIACARHPRIAVPGVHLRRSVDAVAEAQAAAANGTPESDQDSDGDLFNFDLYSGGMEQPEPAARAAAAQPASTKLATASQHAATTPGLSRTWKVGSAEELVLHLPLAKPSVSENVQKASRAISSAWVAVSAQALPTTASAEADLLGVVAQAWLYRHVGIAHDSHDGAADTGQQQWQAAVAAAVAAAAAPAAPAAAPAAPAAPAAAAAAPAAPAAAAAPAAPAAVAGPAAEQLPDASSVPASSTGSGPAAPALPSAPTPAGGPAASTSPTEAQPPAADKPASSPSQQADMQPNANAEVPLSAGMKRPRPAEEAAALPPAGLSAAASQPAQT